MNKIRLLLVGLFTLCLSATFLPAQATGSYWIENPNLSVTFWQGNDWGKMNSTHTELTPRDNECDGNIVYFYLRHNNGGTFDFRYIDDQNGCDAGGGSGTINPNYWDYVMLCEVQDDGSSYCTDKYYLPYN